MIVLLVDEARAAGARYSRCCGVLGLSTRTLERWRAGGEADGRHGPHGVPSNKLSGAERANILETVNTAEFRDLSPNQIVPLLADRGCYMGSEATIYRILRDEEQLEHRGRAKAPVRHAPRAHTATGPNQLWSWDITYLMTPVRGVFQYLYLMMDVWSRKIVGWAVHEEESAANAAQLLVNAARSENVNPAGIVLHSDNGGPMKGATMAATLERLGVLASFSRPGVSNDNPFSEALFRTFKYRPGYPRGAFASIAAAREWVRAFVRWYNTQHLHSAISFVTPADRHAGADVALLAARARVYEKARARRPDRWSGNVRNWAPQSEVFLNPERDRKEVQDRAAA
jgi:putative transposase